MTTTEHERPAFARSALLTYATSAGVAALSLGNVMVTSRALGTHGRGQIALLTTIAVLTSQLAAFGVPQAAVALTGRIPDAAAVIRRTAARVGFLLGAGAAAIVALLAVALPHIAGGSPVWLLAVVLACIPLVVVQLCLQSAAVARYRFAIANVTSVLPALLNVTANATCWALGCLTAASAVIVWVSGQLVVTALLIGAVAREHRASTPPERGLAARLLGFGAKAHLGATMTWGSYRLDQWLLGGLVGETALGAYSVAVAWSESLFLMPAALAMVLRPDIARAGGAEARSQATQVFRTTVLLTVPLAGVIALTAPVLCVGLLGSQFHASVGQLRILTLGCPGVVAMKIFADALMLQRRPLRASAAAGAAFTATVGLDLALIPTVGGTGAAVASVAAYTLGGAAAAGLFLRTVGGTVSELVPQRSDVVTVGRAVRRITAAVHSERVRSSALARTP